MLRANVIDAPAPQTASLGDKNWVQLWGFHGRQVWRLYYEALFLCMVSQYHDFDTFNPRVTFTLTPNTITRKQKHDLKNC